MSLRLSELEFKQLIAQREGRDKESVIPINVEKSNKFHAVMVEAHERKFPSKKHYRFYLDLVCKQKAREIWFFLREVPFDLPGHYEKNGRIARHRVDFMIAYPDRTFEFVEVKGRDYGEGKLRRAIVEETYNLKIRVV